MKAKKPDTRRVIMKAKKTTKKPAKQKLTPKPAKQKLTPAQVQALAKKEDTAWQNELRNALVKSGKKPGPKGTRYMLE